LADYISFRSPSWPFSLFFTVSAFELSFITIFAARSIMRCRHAFVASTLIMPYRAFRQPHFSSFHFSHYYRLRFSSVTPRCLHASFAFTSYSHAKAARLRQAEDILYFQRAERQPSCRIRRAPAIFADVRHAVMPAERRAPPSERRMMRRDAPTALHTPCRSRRCR